MGVGQTRRTTFTPANFNHVADWTVVGLRSHSCWPVRTATDTRTVVEMAVDRKSNKYSISSSIYILHTIAIENLGSFSPMDFLIELSRRM